MPLSMDNEATKTREVATKTNYVIGKENIVGNERTLGSVSVKYN